MGKRSEITTRQQTNVRMRITQQSSMIVDRLVACVAGELELDGTQLKAADLLLSRTIPTMQSIQHEVQQTEVMSEGEALAKLAILLKNNPGIAPNVIAGELAEPKELPDPTEH